MGTARGFGRIIGFSDGVVAIAITLLILPLVDEATTIDTDAWTFVLQHGFQFFAFLLSFAVIGRFWLVHHEIYERAIGYNAALLWANLLWLLTIVFLPFPTELLGWAEPDDRSVYVLYVGTMVLTSAAALLQQWILIRSPELQAPEVRGTLRLLPFVSILVIMLMALVLTLLFSNYGLLSLLLLALASPAERMIDRRRTKETA